MEKIKKSPQFIAFLGITLAYSILTITTPVKDSVAENYEVSSSVLRLVNLSVVIPILVIYYISFFGYWGLKKYAQKIKDHKDGEGYMLMARGMGWLAFMLPVRSLVGSIFDYIGRHNTSLDDERTIIVNFVTVVFSLLAFMYISDGANLLHKNVTRTKIKNQEHLWVVGAIIFSGLFTMLVLKRPTGEDRVYYLSDIAVLILIIIPYLYAWYRGLHAAFSISKYRSVVSGSLYKASLKHLSYGIVGAVVASVAIQVLIAVSAQLNRLEIQPVLLIVYMLLFLLGVSFFLIKRGASELLKIEVA